MEGGVFVGVSLCVAIIVESHVTLCVRVDVFLNYQNCANAHLRETVREMKREGGGVRDD